MIDIPRYDTFVKIEPINKGWSSDRKYCIETENVGKLLLCISDISEYDKKKAEFDAVCAVMQQGISMSRPIGFGTCNGEQSVYMLLSWIHGEDAETG